MVDERDISQEKEWFYRERAERAADRLQKRGINATYVSKREEAIPIILGMIPDGATIARGDSITLDQIGILPELRKLTRNKLMDPFEIKPDGYWANSWEERRRMMRETFSSDIFITGTSAITLDGKLVNIDGLGNRVAAIIFGPEKVIIVAGANKIVKDVDEALERIHQVAAPMNAMRHLLKHHYEALADLPCVRTGRCVGCNHESSICQYTVIIEGSGLRQRGRINVVLIGEELGL